MTWARPLPATARPGWIALLLIALAVRALVPSGWMPSASGLGLTFCNGDVAMPSFAEIARHSTDGVPLEIAVARAAIDRAEGKGDPPRAPADPHPCAFAGMAPALPGPTLFALPLPATPPSVAPVLTQRTVTVGRGLSAPPPPSTGPPLLA